MTSLGPCTCLDARELRLVEETFTQAQANFRAGFLRGLEALRYGQERNPTVDEPIEIPLDLNKIVDNPGLNSALDFQAFEEAGYHAAIASSRGDREVVLRNPTIPGPGYGFSERKLVWQVWWA